MRVPRRRQAGALLALAGVATAGLAACLPQPVTSEGHDIATTYRIFGLIAAVVATIVIGSTTFAAIRYRRSRRPDLPPQTRGNVLAETIWTLIPALTVGGLFALTVLTLVRVDSTEAAPGAEVEVSAFRWGWTFRYPAADVIVTGIGEPGPEIVVPVGEPVRFTITSADVIHSFFVPAFLQKRDANPGRQNVLQVTIEEPGTYRGQCAEYCGLYHWRMPFAVRAVPRAEYEAWLAAQPRGLPPSIPIGSPLASPPVPAATPSEAPLGPGAEPPP